MLLHYCQQLAMLRLTYLLLFTFYVTTATSQQINRAFRNGPNTASGGKRVQVQYHEEVNQARVSDLEALPQQALGYVVNRDPGDAYHSSYIARKRGYKYQNPEPTSTTPGYSYTTKAPRRTRPPPLIESYEENDSVGLFPPERQPRPVSPVRDFLTTTASPLARPISGDIRDSIPGQPKRDYPILSKIPRTNFSCEGRIPGYYADPETRCQVFHRCNDCNDQPNVQMESFLCPNGTEFNQQLLTCDWWANVMCPESEYYFGINTELGAKYEDGTYVVLSAGRRPPAVKKVAPGIIPVEEREALPAELQRVPNDNGQPNEITTQQDIRPQGPIARPQISTTRRPGNRRTTGATTPPAPPAQSFLSSDSSDYFDEIDIGERRSNLEEEPTNDDRGGEILFRTGIPEKSAKDRSSNNKRKDEISEETKPESFIVNRLPNKLDEKPQREKSGNRQNRTVSNGELVFPEDPKSVKNPDQEIQKSSASSNSPKSGYSSSIEQPNDEYLPPKKDSGLEKPNDEYLPPRKENALSNDYLPPSSGWGYQQDLNRYVTPPPLPPRDSYEPIPDSHYRQPSNGYTAPHPLVTSYGPPQDATSYGAPQAEVFSYGAPQAAVSSYGPPQVAVSSYSPPQTATSISQPQKANSHSQPQAPSSYGPPQVLTSHGPPQTATSISQPQAPASYGPPQVVTSYGPPQTAASISQPQKANSHSQPQAPASYGPPQVVTSNGLPQTATSNSQPQKSTSHSQPQAPAFYQPQVQIIPSYNQPQVGNYLPPQTPKAVYNEPQPVNSYSQQPPQSYNQPQPVNSYNQPQAANNQVYQPVVSQAQPLSSYGEPYMPVVSFGEPPVPKASFGEPPTSSGYQQQIYQAAASSNIPSLIQPSIQTLHFTQTETLTDENHHRSHPHLFTPGPTSLQGKK